MYSIILVEFIHQFSRKFGVHFSVIKPGLYNYIVLAAPGGSGGGGGGGWG